MPEELQPTKLEVAGSNPASADNDGRVAQRIEHVTISPPLVAEVPPMGGCRQDYIVWKQRVRFPPPETAKSCQSSRPPLFRYGRQMPEELHSTSEGRGFESRPAANKLLWQDSSGVEHRKRISPTPSCPPYPLFYGGRRMPEGVTLTFHVKKPYPFKY